MAALMFKAGFFFYYCCILYHHPYKELCRNVERGTYIMLRTAWPDHQSSSKMCPRRCPKTSPKCLKMCTPKNISIPCTHHTYATPSFRKLSSSSTLMSTYILKEWKFVNEIVQKCKYIGMG